MGIPGATGAALGKSLVAMTEIVDGTLAEVRLAATRPRRERASLLDFIDEVAIAARLHAEYRGIRLKVEAVDPDLAIDVDRQLLTSALMNLVQNALKFTPAGGGVTVRTHAENGRILIDVEDECGGMPEGGRGERRRDRTPQPRRAGLRVQYRSSPGGCPPGSVEIAR